MSSITTTITGFSTAKKRSMLKEPGSAITHGIALVLAILGSIPLLIKAADKQNILFFAAMGIFIFSMILLYAASTIYHSVDSSEKVNRRLRKIDHMMIFLMIAGGYTPICLLVLHNRMGHILCGVIWLTAVAGMLLKACWVTCPKWLSSVLYIGLGWFGVPTFSAIFHNLLGGGLGWFLAGGILYTIGGIVYALRLPIFNSRHKNFGSHEVFHIFTMLGSACHFILMYFYIM